MENTNKEIEVLEMSSVKELSEKYRELQNSSVSKEEYEAAVKKLKEENSQLITALTQNTPIKMKDDEFDKSARAHEISSIIRSQADNKTLSDKELLRLLVEQRDLTLEATGVDIMVGSTHMTGAKAVIEKEDADEIAQSFKEILVYADTHHLELTDAIKSLRQKGTLRIY